MTVTLETLRTDVMRRLGDSAGAIWTANEIDSYIAEGYDDLCIRTGCLWETNCFPDKPASFNFTYEWERESAESHGSEYCDGPYNFTYEWERNNFANSNGPANHNYPWEFHESYFAPPTEISPIVDLPEEAYELERSTWGTRVLAPMRSSDLEPRDSRYELNKGIVEGYTQDKDGLRRLRKWRVPSSAYVPYDFDSSSDDGFGIIRFCGDICSGMVLLSGDYGDLVQVDGINCFEDFGILGPVYKETNSMRVEYRRRGKELSVDQPFEIQDRYTVYVRHYAQSLALDRDGHGYEPKLAAHYMERYLAGVERVGSRKNALQYSKTSVMGGRAPSIVGDGPPNPRLPWQFGRKVRR